MVLLPNYMWQRLRKVELNFFFSFHSIHNLPGNSTERRSTVGTCTYKSWAATFIVTPASSYKETVVLYMRKQFSVRHRKCRRLFEIHVIQTPRLREVCYCDFILLYSNRRNQINFFASKSISSLFRKL